MGWCARMSPPGGFPGPGVFSRCVLATLSLLALLIYDPVLPGPGIEIRSKLGWSRRENSGRSGVWLFRGAFQGVDLFSSLAETIDWGVEGIVPHSVGGPWEFSVLLFICVMGRAQLSGHIQVGGVFHCSCTCGGPLSLP